MADRVTGRSTGVHLFIGLLMLAAVVTSVRVMNWQSSSGEPSSAAGTASAPVGSSAPPTSELSPSQATEVEPSTTPAATDVSTAGEAEVSTAVNTNGLFAETFDGSPAVPTAWNQAGWDVSVHSRDTDTWESLEPVMAHHGPDCSAPLARHVVTAYEDAVFSCKDHVMTSINASGYGAIYLTPNQIANFADEPVVIKVDVSTWRASSRDWWDVWVTPFDENVQLPFESTDPDLQGPPKDAVHVRLGSDNNLYGEIYKDHQMFQSEGLKGAWWTGYDSFLTQDPAKRTTVQIEISKTHIKIGMPEHDFWWVDTDVPELNFSSGVVQFGHHSYTPEKDCGVANNPAPDGTCTANTWHWDNVSISNAVPFTLLNADVRRVFEGTPNTVKFAAPAPADSFLRFAARGNVEVSYNNGASWQPAHQQDLVGKGTSHFTFYWTSVPKGTTTVKIRGTGNESGPWYVRDISIWSLHG